MQVGYILSLTKSSVTSCVRDSFCTYGPIFGLGEAAPELLPLDRPLNQDRVDEHQAIL